MPDFDRLGTRVSQSLFSAVCVCLLRKKYDNVLFICTLRMTLYALMCDVEGTKASMKGNFIL